jgi:hypothetical protein
VRQNRAAGGPDHRRHLVAEVHEVDDVDRRRELQYPALDPAAPGAGTRRASREPSSTTRASMVLTVDSIIESSKSRFVAATVE